MLKTERIRAEFVEFIPKSLETGVIYISKKYMTASHLCCCGCGNKVVTPLKQGGWQVSVNHGAVSLSPSIGNWNLPCKSHYWIRNNQVLPASQWTEAEIERGRHNDQREREEYFNSGQGFFGRMIRWLKRVWYGR